MSLANIAVSMPHYSLMTFGIIFVIFQIFSLAFAGLIMLEVAKGKYILTYLLPACRKDICVLHLKSGFRVQFMSTPADLLHWHPSSHRCQYRVSRSSSRGYLQCEMHRQLCCNYRLIRVRIREIMSRRQRTMAHHHEDFTADFMRLLFTMMLGFWLYSQINVVFCYLITEKQKPCCNYVVVYSKFSW